MTSIGTGYDLSNSVFSPGMYNRAIGLCWKVQTITKNELFYFYNGIELSLSIGTASLFIDSDSAFYFDD
jgi:hypothetical protein